MKYIFISLWPFQILLNIPSALKKLTKGDSFYAESLGLFYLRQLGLIQKKDIYVSEAGELKLETFFYQSFASIYICYVIIGRRLYATTSIFILISAYIYFLTNNSLAISLIVILSGVVYFQLIERGNYQILPLILSICAIMSIESSGLNFLGLVLLFISANLSVSVALLLSIYFFIDLLITFDGIYLHLLAFTALSFSVNAIFNLVLISKKSNKRLNLIRAIENIFNVVGVKSSSKLSNSRILTRPYTFKSAIFSILPLFFLLPIFLFSNKEILFVLLLVIMFLNQSKLLRFFDYHLLYSWIFFYSSYLLGVNNFEIYSYIGLFLFGTNPILTYALDSYNTKKTRGFILESVVVITNHEVRGIQNGLSNFLNSDSPVIISPLSEVSEYNDLWRKESLLLEWVWDSLERNNVCFFPDWYSIFYTEHGYKLFVELNKSSEDLSEENYKILNIIDKRVLAKNDYKNLKISSLFPGDVMKKHLSPLDNYYLQLL